MTRVINFGGASMRQRNLFRIQSNESQARDSKKI